jgi:hypothetical protein
LPPDARTSRRRDVDASTNVDRFAIRNGAIDMKPRGCARKLQAGRWSTLSYRAGATGGSGSHVLIDEWRVSDAGNVIQSAGVDRA